MKLFKMRAIVDWFGVNITVSGFAVIASFIGLGMAVYQSWSTPVSAESGGTTINIDMKHSTNPKNCMATKNGSSVTCIDNHYENPETYKIQGSTTGFTYLFPLDKPWNSLKTSKIKLFNGTKIRIIQQLDGESATAAIAVIEVQDGPHKGKKGKINMALVTKS